VSLLLYRYVVQSLTKWWDDTEVRMLLERGRMAERKACFNKKKHDTYCIGSMCAYD
jgi:hypothetical protein